MSKDGIEVSGLPARKIVYATFLGDRPATIRQILLMTEEEHWRLTVYGFEGHLESPADPLYQQVQQAGASFEFLEPAQARLKAKVSAAPRSPALPEDLRMTAELQTRLSAKSVKVGDPVRLVADADVRLPGGGT
jgi:hypothetical protein